MMVRCARSIYLAIYLVMVGFGKTDWFFFIHIISSFIITPFPFRRCSCTRPVLRPESRPCPWSRPTAPDRPCVSDARRERLGPRRPARKKSIIRLIYVKKNPRGTEGFQKAQMKAEVCESDMAREVNFVDFWRSRWVLQVKITPRVKYNNKAVFSGFYEIIIPPISMYITVMNVIECNYGINYSLSYAFLKSVHFHPKKPRFRLLLDMNFATLTLGHQNLSWNKGVE